MDSPAGLALLDANVLIYAEQGLSPYYVASKSLRDHALTGEVPACLSPQVLNEFYAIVTNPNRVDEPLTAREAIDEIRIYYQAKRLAKIYPGPAIIERELVLLEAHPVAGAGIHDLHLVATMLENGVRRIYTFNIRDFAPFSEIETLIPPEPVPEPERSPSPEPPSA
jgi:predicted nucleic acid-binding protein